MARFLGIQVRGTAWTPGHTGGHTAPRWKRIRTTVDLWCIIPRTASPLKFCFQIGKMRVSLARPQEEIVQPEWVLL